MRTVDRDRVVPQYTTRSGRLNRSSVWYGTAIDASKITVPGTIRKNGLLTFSRS